MKTLLIDADSLCFINADNEQQAIEKLESKLEHIKRISSPLGVNSFKFFLTIGKCFRYELLPTYKENRTYVVRNPLVKVLKDYLIEKYDAVYDERFEADDLVCDIYRSDMNKYVIASIDKDLLYNLSGTHLNLMIMNFIEVSEKEAEDSLYKQVIKGDTVDNIPNLLPNVGEKRLEELKERTNLSFKELSYYICNKLEVEYNTRFRLLYCGDSSELKIENITVEDNEMIDKYISFSKGEIKYNDIVPKEKKERKVYDKISFGKHKGKTFKELFILERSYFNWLLNETSDENLKASLLEVIPL